MEWRIIHTLQDFIIATEGWSEVVACDTETYGEAWNTQSRKLLGISLSPEAPSNVSLYIPLYVYNGESLEKSSASDGFLNSLRHWLSEKQLVGHNFTYDRRWLELWDFDTFWKADTRLMWHLKDNSLPRGFGLKDAQREILGWKDSNDKVLAAHVRAKGGDVKKGDHYMADLHLLAEYACYDTLATIEVYKKLKGFFEEHDYWWMLKKAMDYNIILEGNTHDGVFCDVVGLEKAKEVAEKKVEKFQKELYKVLGPVIKELEKDWLDTRLTEYKRDYSRTKLLNEPHRWKKFNWNSSDDKADLFYGKLKNPVEYKTPGGKPSTNRDAIKNMEGKWKEAYLELSKYEYLLSNFINSWLASVHEGKLHPGFNITGTMSYRLSGFKPYFLNLPFGETFLMKNFGCPEGYVGVHSDLVSIEPAITAHFSEDPYLLKVFGEGLGDIYLDLALELFPDNVELKEIYNSRVPIEGAVKQRLDHVRKPAKVVQLAVQYTGTGHTVAKNLTKAGVSTTVEQADGYVRAYWRKFRKVKEFEYKLRKVYKQQGHLRSVIGRIIHMSEIDHKDTMNRFIQTSAHDCLVLWVLEIDRLRKERNIEMRPLLFDCHDSTSWMVRKDQKAEGKKIFDDALENVNKQLNLIVRLKADTKYFQTFSGLKGDEE